jgi:hypothetical protein
MAFKIATNPTYTAQVKVDIPSDNGKTVPKAFGAVFKRLSQSELDGVSDRLAAKELTDSGLIDEVMVGWSDVQDEDGTVLEFNDKNLAALLDVFPVRPTLVKTFFASIAGAKTKN